jgi:putative ABC transport system permease protein
MRTWSKLKALLWRKQLEADMAEEMRAHLEMQERANRAAGMAPDEARYAARRQFGHLDGIKETARDQRRLGWFEDAWRDLRFAARSLRKNLGFSLATVLVLALGLGGVTAMFSTVYAVAIRPLPYPEPDRLVFGRATFNGNINPWVSGPDYADYRDQGRSFEALEAFFCVPKEYTVTDGRDAERVRVLLATTGLHRILGVRMTLGRSFTDEDGRAGAASVALISHAYWRKHFAEATDLTGRSLVIDGHTFAVVGVMPPDFHFVYDTDVVLPVWASDLGPRRYKNWLLVGRLRKGVTLASAQSEIDVIGARLERAYPDTNTGEALLLTPFQSAVAEQYRSSFSLLCAGAGAVLLIACANAAGLLLARGAGRHSELAVRAALGASPGRIVRFLLAEALVLAGVAGIAGAALAIWLQRGLVGLLPEETLLLRDVALSRPVLGFALGVTLAVGFVFGLLPAWRTRPTDITRDLRAGGRSIRAHGIRLRRGLVIGQVAISFALLFVAGLLLRSFAALRGADLGFDRRNLLTVEVPLPPQAYPGAKSSEFFTRLVDDVRSLPGVVSVAAIDGLPLRNPYNNVGIYAAANPPANPQAGSSGFQRIVLPGYFRSMGIPLVAGRDIEATDTVGSRRVVLISQRLAARLFPQHNPLGQTVIIDEATDAPWEVVGVVGDVTQCSPTEGSDTFGSFYRAYPQQPWSTIRLAIRTAGDPHAVVPAVGALLRRMDFRVPLSGPRTMDELLANTTISEKAQTTFLATFSLLALTLAGAGIFGLLLYVVAARRQEIGIRMALGATVGGIVRGVLREAASLALVGMLAGGAGALAAARLLRASLFGVGPSDPVVLVAAAAALALVVGLAAWLPARRAAKVDPVIALRAE